MKKNVAVSIKSVAIFAVFAIFSSIFVGCSNLTSSSEEVSYGSIVGGVRYDDGRTDNSGIIVAIEKVDGVRSSSVLASTVTDTDGNYAFYNLSEGIYTVYASTADGSEKSISKNVEVVSSKTTRLNWKNLESYGTVEGYITKNGNSSNNLGFTVFLAGTSFIAITDDSGFYSIPEVPVGTYELCVSKGNMLYVGQETITTKKNKTITADTKNFTSEQISTGIVIETSESDGAVQIWICAEDISSVKMAYGEYDSFEDLESATGVQTLSLSGHLTEKELFANGSWSIGVSTTDGRSFVQVTEISSVEKGIGDIVMSDGTYLTASAYSSYTGSAFPVAVIVGSYDGRKLGVGIVNSGSTTYKWAPTGTTGYTTYFEDLSFGNSWDSENQKNVWTGNIDGSDDWSVICSVDSSASANASTNYPAYNYALNYGTIAELTNTSYATDWYIPTFVEVVYFWMYEDEYLPIAQSTLDLLGIDWTGMAFWFGNERADGCKWAAQVVSMTEITTVLPKKSDAYGVIVIREFD